MYSENLIIDLPREADAKVVRNRVKQYLETALIEDDSPVLVRAMDRIDDYGEVFTPNWFVKQMLDFMPGDPVADLDKSTLDPSCGNGQFLTEALRRRLAKAAVLLVGSLNYEEYEFDCLRGLSKLYGIDINADTATEARERMATIVFKAYAAVVGVQPHRVFCQTVEYILGTNIVVGDFLKENFSLMEWVPKGKHSFERKLWHASAIFAKKSQRGTLFYDGIEPSETFPPAHWKEIAGGEN